MVRDGCSFGRESRIMIQDIKTDISDLKREQKEGFNNLDNKMTELFNHQSSKLPPWVTVIGTLGGTILGALVIWGITHAV